MTNLEEIIEQKKKDNRQLATTLAKAIIEDKKELSIKVLEIGNEKDVREVINKLVLMICDIQVLSSLNSNYNELTNITL